MTTQEKKNRAIDRKARMKLPFEEQPIRPVEERVKDFGPTFLPLTPEAAQRAAERCIHCKDPAPCQRACPGGNDISEAMWLIEEGDFLGAAELYRKTSSMPEICGRVCPHESLCQGACPRAKKGQPVLTGMLEAFVADYQREHGTTEVPVGESTGKHVAIVGSGPAGLSCAERLVVMGHRVTVLEAAPTPGGLLLYGIPNFKLPKDVVGNRIDDLKKAGVEFVSNVRIGKGRTVDDLLAEGFDAVFVGVGSGIDAPMKVPGAELPGVHQATEFLVRANVNPDFLPHGMDPIVDVGKKIAVIGGGDTASDCLRTALRLGADEVTCLYRRTEAEMPGGEEDRALAKAEQAKFHFLVQPITFIEGDDGHVSAVEVLQCELGEPDRSGRRRPIPIEGSNFTVEVDTVVLALGYWPDPEIGETTPDLKTHNWGLIEADPETGATSRPGVFAGGDAATGPATVVAAMVAGRRSAVAIHDFLANG